MPVEKFSELCAKHCIDPALAFENADLTQALRDRDDELVEEILANQC